MPLLLGFIFYEIWMRYSRTVFISKLEPVLLEIKVPKEVNKSPAAMEVVLSGLYQTFSGTLTLAYLKGFTRAWFSLELVSMGGAVKFYVWTPKLYKNNVEALLYSQYPNIEVHEVEDYSLGFNYDKNLTALNGGQMGLTKPDVYPIKTYVDYGLDKDPKEEYKIDPLVPLVEYLGSLKPHEQAWIQILIRAHKSEGLKEGHLLKKEDWKKAAKEEIKKILKESLFAPAPAPDGGEVRHDYMRLSPAEKDAVMAIERSINKFAFDTMIRMIYFAPKNLYDLMVPGNMVDKFKHQFSSQTLNGFTKKWGPTYDYKWQDFRGTKEITNKRKLVDAYKRRSFFNPPYKNFHGKPFILTTEELATIYHLPGEVAKTPTFERVLSKKSEAPANLPV